MLFAVAIERGSLAQAFGVVVPDIPGCFSGGDSLEEALANTRTAIEGHVECLCEDGLEIPQASDPHQHVLNPDYAGWVWALVEVDLTPFLGKSQKVNVTLPEALIRRIDQTVSCKPIYKSRSGFLAQAALNELSRSAQ